MYEAPQGAIKYARNSGTPRLTLDLKSDGNANYDNGEILIQNGEPVLQ